MAEIRICVVGNLGKTLLKTLLNPFLEPSLKVTKNNVLFEHTSISNVF